QAEVVVEPVLLLEDDPIALWRLLPLLTTVQVREGEDRAGREQRHPAEDDERRAVDVRVVVADDQDDDERGERPALADRGHPPEDAAAPLLGRQAHAERVLRL